MALREDLEKQGNWLFRYRSYLPLLAIPIFLIALRNSEQLERMFGRSVEMLWGVASIGVSFLGLIIRCIVAGYAPRGTSGRNTKSQVAEVLNTTGIYSIVRNPLYLGNFVIVLGATLFIQVWWLALIVWVGFWIYYERIILAEENFLREKFGDSFLKWAAITPVYFPKFKNWKKPNLPFSFKTVLRREFPTFFAIISSFYLLDIAEDLLAEGKFELSLLWTVLFIFGFIIYIILLILKKKTHILDVSGR